MKIVILEDNPERRAAMESCLRDRFHQFESVFFDDAPRMLEFLENELPNAVLLSLDHDLEIRSTSNGKRADPGTGRDVVNFLVGRPPSCPVVVATTNSAAGDGMEFALRDAGWDVVRVFPWSDHDWISAEWLRTVRNAIVRNAQPRNGSTLPLAETSPKTDAVRGV